MCWGIYLAVPAGTSPLGKAHYNPDPDDAQLAPWIAENPWIPLVFGDEYECWMLGQGQHCSCGCVSSRSDSSVGLSSMARTYIADLADKAGQLGLAIHWTSGDFREEELPFEITDAMVASVLRSESKRELTSETFYWIQGC